MGRKRRVKYFQTKGNPRVADPSPPPICRRVLVGGQHFRKLRFPVPGATDLHYTNATIDPEVPRRLGDFIASLASHRKTLQRIPLLRILRDRQIFPLMMRFSMLGSRCGLAKQHEEQHSSERNGKIRCGLVFVAFDCLSV